MSATNKLRFKVVSFSSEDEDHPAIELNTVNPSTKGWHSVRFCSFPQELGFELIDGDARMSQIQILSHQSKIASKIEIYVGKGDHYTTATYKRLGYLSLDNNERSSYNARELKTVFVDFTGRFLKLLINENHINKLNIYSQVGIIAVSILGTELDNDNDAKSSSSHKNKNVRRHIADSPTNPYNDLSVDLNLDPQTADKLRQLADAKLRAIDQEDYLTAKEIKAVEQDLRVAGSKLAQLDMAKAAAVREEDYDRAKELKDQADVMREEIENKIMAISIPGVSLSAKAAPKHKQTPKFAASMKEDSYKNDIDDMPVGGGNGGGGGYGGGMGSGTKKVAKVEAHHHSAYDDNMNGAGISPRGNGNGYGQYEDDPYAEEEDLSAIPLMERPIKPKALGYGDPSHMGGDIDDDPNGYRGGPAEGPGGAGGSQFPPGQHPLEGVPGCNNFVVPENFGTSKNKELSDSSGITALLGEHRAKCLFSKTWAVREAAMAKVLLMFRDELSRDPGVSACLAGLCGVIRVGVEDKIQQVLFNAVQLMEDVLIAAKSAKLPRAQVAPLFDPIIVQCIEKQNDGNARLRDGGRKGLDICAAATNALGPQVVASHALRPIPAKQKTAWRPLYARIKLLADLVTTYGLSGASGLNAETLLALPKSSQAFSHSSGEVRFAAMELVVAIQKIAGTPAVDSAMKELRAKQKEEYEHAFMHGMPTRNPDGTLAEAKPSAGTGGAGAKGAKPQDKDGGGGSRTDKHLQHATHSPGGKVNTSAAKVANSKDGYAPHSHSQQQQQQQGDCEPPQDFTSCMFCSVHNPSWTEADLDVHYWKDCPLLISCPSCAQIVEIAGLPEHQLDECDSKDSYKPCDVTGLAIREVEMDAWKRSGNCKPAPENCMYCPLCLSSVEDSDEAWLDHLTHGCPRNTRTNGSQQN